MTQAADEQKRTNDGTRSPLIRLRRLGPALTALASVGLLAAGCGGGGSPGIASVASTATAPPATTVAPATPTRDAGGGGSSGADSPAAPRGGNRTVMDIGNATAGTRFAACMRNHGVPNFPDPNSQGLIQFGSAIDPRSPAFRSAQHTCRTLLPPGFGQPPTAAQLAQVQQALVAFSSCMHAHGIADFPEPSGAALPQIQPTGDLDPNNPRFQTAYNACKTRLPAGLPGKALGGLTPPTTGNTGAGG